MASTIRFLLLFFLILALIVSVGLNAFVLSTPKKSELTSTTTTTQTFSQIELETVTKITTSISSQLPLLSQNPFGLNDGLTKLNGVIDRVVPIFFLKPNESIELFVNYSKTSCSSCNFTSNNIVTTPAGDINLTSKFPFFVGLQQSRNNPFPIINSTSGSVLLLENNSSYDVVLFSVMIPGNSPSGYYNVIFPFSCSQEPLIVFGNSDLSNLNYSLIQQQYGQRYINFGCNPGTPLDTQIIAFAGMNFTQTAIPYNSSLP
jgi:hypothetical protein